MRLKTKLNLTAVATISIPAAAAVMMLFTKGAVDGYLERLDRMARIADHCFELHYYLAQKTHLDQAPSPERLRRAIMQLNRSVYDLEPARENEKQTVDHLRSHLMEISIFTGKIASASAAGTKPGEPLGDLMLKIEMAVSLSNELRDSAYNDMVQFRRHVDISLLTALTLFALALGAGILWGSRRLIARIDTIQSRMRAISEGDLDQAVAAPGDDEMGAMAGEFDKVTERLRSSISQQDRLSRELKVHELAEAEIHRNQDQTRQWLNSCTDGVWDWYMDADYEYMSPRFWELFGYDPDTRKQHPSEWQKILVSDDMERFEAKLRDHTASQGLHPFAEELRFQHKDGGIVWVMCRGMVIEWNEDGSPRRMVGTHTDITRTKEAEIEARDAHKLLRSIINQSPDIIYAKDTSGRYVLLNQAGAAHYGKPIAEIIGKTAAELLPPDTAADVMRDEETIITTATPRTFEEPAPGEGQDRILLTSKAPLKDAAGNIIGLIAIARDITEITRVRENLVIRSEELERSNRELEQFAYIASHDLQEPLRKICAFGDLLTKDCSESLSADGRQYLDFMKSASGRMQTLIRDLLNLSRVTTRPQKLENVSLANIVTEVLSDLELAIEDAGADIRVGDLPSLQADPMQMRQMLQNMISNSLKFRNNDVPPLITLAPEPVEDAEQGQVCRFSIRDNGIGFDAQYAERIFGVFQRLHTRSEYEGSGMGLTICRRIAERHHGTITVTSTPGAGTTFVITLPLHQPDNNPDA